MHSIEGKCVLIKTKTLSQRVVEVTMNAHRSYLQDECSSISNCGCKEAVGCAARVAHKEANHFIDDVRVKI